MAKLIIKLINCVAETVDANPATEGLLRVFFLKNYNVSLAERIFPAADLSEQISTAGTEASGTGNMKMALNGALTIGTWDGATIEMAEEIGRENLFLFGHTEPELAKLRQDGYNPQAVCDRDPELRHALEMIRDGAFSPREPGIFWPLIDALLHQGDRFFVLADFRAYCEAQERAASLFANDRREWTRRSILNVARVGKFSSDRAIAQYASEIWGVTPE